ncbi:MAG: class E sortase [Candidatus Dojkabacteria bacterium]|nr:class E sortase [Candidatus Dojkabacteria bacterium]
MAKSNRIKGKMATKPLDKRYSKKSKSNPEKRTSKRSSTVKKFTVRIASEDAKKNDAKQVRPNFLLKIQSVILVVRNKIDKLNSHLKKKIDTDKRYRIASKVLTYVMFLLGLYLLLYPIVPGLIYKLFYKGKEVYPYQTVLEGELVDNDNAKLGGKEIPEENRLVIPAINVDMPIVEGSNEDALNLGVWHRPGTGSPGQGNMVLTGHRVGYAFLPDDVKNSTSFYNLDQLESGDYIIIYWGGVEYDYKVTGNEVVPKTATYIESQADEEKLTLYTCHPVGQNAHRLVYYAKRIVE